ncbi:Spy/CpxP family protein refolding chaperone [Castellaniella sp. UC4442_H9]|jgi:Spy/CpxP family protein refolding chaperone|nr:Spy/CpxP family protein refolding chaperone [Castellaniella sp.]
MASTFSRTYSTLALVAAMAAAPLIATAATDGPSDSNWPRHHQKMHRGHGMEGGWGAPMLRKLNLTQAQQDQIFKIRHDQAQAFYDQHKAVRAARKSLRELTMADSFDQAKAQQAAQAIGQADAQLALLRAETQAQIRAVLTPEQRQQLADQRAGRRGNHAKPTQS